MKSGGLVVMAVPKQKRRFNRSAVFLAEADYMFE
jgi:hypothetical protein